MNILILGLGQYPQGSGVSAAVYFAEKGESVRVTDLKREEDLVANVARLKKYPNVSFVLGRHRKQDIRWADIVVRNPLVRPHSEWMVLARKLGKRVESDVSLFMGLCPCAVVGITGTRGKSTTSTLVAEMLKASGKRVWLGGNITISPLTFIEKVRPGDIVVLELSSWMLETTGMRRLAPSIACITNIMRDHLNTYENMDAYVESKAQIFRHQSPGDVLVLNADDPYAKRFAKEAPSKVLTFSLKKGSDSDGLLSRNGVRLAGDHNFINAIAAAVVAKAAGGTLRGIRKAAKAFRGLANRQEVISTRGGVRFVNDTTATTPDATRVAVETFGSDRGTVHLLFGGADKELEFNGIATLLKKKKACVTVFDGTAFPKIERAFKRVKLPFQLVTSMTEAVDYHRSHAKKGDIVLLSPGCASFGLFKNEFDRGDQFNAHAKKRI